jgi:ABC-type multidrug transport system fused ATPase/permease subunit
VAQSVTLMDNTILFNITFKNNYDINKLNRVARASKIYDFIVSLPDGYNTLVGENGVRLSGGQKQRIGIARALYKNPEILIFDEATSSLDNITEKELSNEISRLSKVKTLIIVAHRLTTVEHCDIIYVFDKGRIIDSGTHHDLLKTCPLYQKMSIKTEETA